MSVRTPGSVGCGPAQHPWRKGPASEIEDIFVCEQFFFFPLFKKKCL